MTGFKRTNPDPRIAPILGNLSQKIFSDTLYQSSELAHEYCIHLTIRLMHELRITPLLTTWRNLAELEAKLGFRRNFQRPLAWMLQNLAVARLLECKENNRERYFRLRTALPELEIAALRRIGLEIDSANANTLDLLDAASRAYEQVAHCEMSAEQALFGMGQLPLWLNYFSNDNPLYSVNNWVSANAAADKLQSLPRFRILELGAGAGSASEALLRTLADRAMLNRLEFYAITEPNAFLRKHHQRRMQQQYRSLTHKLHFGALDLNERWDASYHNAFDLIYCVNTLHIAKELNFSLAQLRRCIDGGWLIAGECIRPFPGQPVYIEMIFQLLDSFTNVDTDSLRPDPGFLTAFQWQALFARAGFEKNEIMPDHSRIIALYPRFATGAVCGYSNGAY